MQEIKLFQYFILKKKTEKMEGHLAEEYNRRPIVEKVNCVIKRKNGSFMRSRIPSCLKNGNENDSIHY